MQFKLFTIPATGDAGAEEELNRFLRSNRAVSVQKELVENGDALRLDLKPVCLNKCSRGMTFLGYRVYPGHVRLAARSRTRFRRKLAQYHGNYMSGRWTEEEVAQRAEPLVAFVRRAESMTFRHHVLESIGGLVRRRLEPREPGRELEQRRQELPFGEPQQQRAWEPQQQPGLPCLPSSTEIGTRPPDRTRSRPRPGQCRIGAKPQGPAGLVGSLERGSKAPPGLSIGFSGKSWEPRQRAASLARLDYRDLQRGPAAEMGLR